jgi:hypothetical protein
MDYLGEKRGPNQWILFTQKVNSALDAAGISTGAATVSKQFASSLKDIKPYAEWTDEAIVEAWSTWGDKPQQSKSNKATADFPGATPEMQAAWAAYYGQMKQSHAAEEAADFPHATPEMQAAWAAYYAQMKQLHAAEEAADYYTRMKKLHAQEAAPRANPHTLHYLRTGAQKAKNRAEIATEQKAVRILNARESERAANMIFPRQNQTRRKPTWGIPNIGPGFGGSRKRKPLRKRRHSRK